MSPPAYTHVFSFGSNSLWQLRLRVENPNLTARPASLPGFTRVFCISSAAWKSGGVASLAPSRYASSPAVRGSVVTLTAAELACLDTYEHGYRQERLTADVDGVATPVVAYIAGDGAGGRWTLPMEAAPSEMYLNACRLHLRENWPHGECDEICIASYGEGGIVEEVGKPWRYPGVQGLELEAMLVECNRMCQEPWVDGGPLRKLNTINAANGFRAVGIQTVPDLTAILRDDGGERMNIKLREAGKAPLKDDMLQSIRKLLLPEAAN